MTAKRQRLKRMERFGNSVFCDLHTLAFSLQPFLSRRSETKTEAFASVAEIIGKFAGSLTLSKNANLLKLAGLTAWSSCERVDGASDSHTMISREHMRSGVAD
jgi:hypothetical protein